MTRTPCPFKVSDVKRALRAAKDVGLNVTGYSIEPDGTLTVQTTKGEDDTNPLIKRLRLVRP